MGAKDFSLLAKKVLSEKRRPVPTYRDYATRFYSVVRIDSFPSRTVSQSRKSLLLLFLTGFMVAVEAQSWETTTVTACVNGSIYLPADDPSVLGDKSEWSVRYQDGPWIKIGSCARTKGCTTSTTVLTDGTTLRIRSNRTLFVNHRGNHRNATEQLQLLLEGSLNHRHIYIVKFTVYCKLLRFLSFWRN